MMNSFFDKMGEKLMPFASKVSANRYLNAIKEGFFGVMPVIIVGSLFLLFTSIPINGYSELMTGLLRGKLESNIYGSLSYELWNHVNLCSCRNCTFSCTFL